MRGVARTRTPMPALRKPFGSWLSRPRPAAESTTYSAIITPNAQVDLAFRVSGYVVDVRRTKGADGRTRAVEPGAAVTTGLVLARIRATDYQAVVDKAQGASDESGAGIDAAEAALAEAQRGIHASGI